MQNNSNTYFDITIRNKYDSVTTKRKEINKITHWIIASVVILCSSLMIFSFDVSSTSETQNSEDIKGKSETYFPTPTAEKVKTSCTTTLDAAGTTEAETPDLIECELHDSVHTSQVNTPQIVSETDNSSENQNDTVVTGSSINITPLSTNPTEISAITANVESDPVETFNAVELLSEVILTPSPTPSQLSQDALSLNPSYISNSLYDEEYNEKLRKEEQEEKERKERRQKQKRKEMHWRNGGSAGHSKPFNETENIAKAIWKYLKSAGYEDGAAAGILGNIEQESSFNPRASTGKYHGLFQLDINDRFANCISWCRNNGYDPYSAEGQTRFALQEMIDDDSRKGQFEHFTGYSKSDYPKIKDPETASFVWTAGYEGCITSTSSYYDGRNAEFQQDSLRRKYSRKWYEKFKGMT